MLELPYSITANLHCPDQTLFIFCSFFQQLAFPLSAVCGRLSAVLLLLLPELLDAVVEIVGYIEFLWLIFEFES